MLATRKIIIGTRGSKLALTQAEEIKNHLIKAHPNYQDNPDLIQITTFKTTGDKILNQSLADIGGKALFIKEIEEALLDKTIDIAVHSMKDMPAFFSPGLEIVAVSKRDDARDAFISNQYNKFEDLPIGAVVGTSSPRRKALMLHQRPDLKIVNFRGNVDTRLNKIAENQVDATILAVAGLNRIAAKQAIKSIIDPEIMLPAIGQGALAIQARAHDDFIIDLAAKLNHHHSQICITAERAFLKTINGSCKTPIAAYCQTENGALYLRVLLASPDGKEIYQTSRRGSLNEAEKLGNNAGLEVKTNAKHILDML